jgi:hypothetical protein
MRSRRLGGRESNDTAGIGRSSLAIGALEARQLV